MMPGLQDRRVQKLRLTAAANDDLWRCRVLLEDAFRTASLPGIPVGRLILVKQFSIGRLSTQQSSASLSKVIDESFRELASQAVPADHPSAASRSVVYFRDEVEPFIKLAVRIAANQETSSWFWPLAARGWRRTMSKSEGLRTMLFQLAESRAGPTGVVALVGELHQFKLLEPLLANLETTDARRLMQLFGWAEPATGSASQSVLGIGISNAAQVVLTEWVKRWTSVDVRSIWLAAVFLVEHKPVRLLDQQLIQRAVSLIEVLSNRTWAAELFASKANLTGEQRTESPPGSDLDSRRGISKAIEQDSNEIDASLHSLLPDPLGVNKGSGAFVEIPNRGHETADCEPETNTATSGLDGPELETDRTRNVKRNRLSTDRSSGDDSSNASSQENPQSSERVSVTERIRETSVSRDRLELSRFAKTETIPETSVPAIETDDGRPVDLNYGELKPAWVDESKVTEFGGFYFLLGVMSRLKIGDFLERHPSLIEFDFPTRLLRFAASQMKIPETDAVMTPFLQLENIDCPAIEFTVPQIWREQLYRSGTLLLSNIEGRPGYRMLTDRSGRSVFSIWCGRAPDDVRRLIGTAAIAVVSARRCEDNARALLACWHRALIRWGHCFGRIGLDYLVQRRGVLSVSRTHLDLFFDLNSVDICIRRSGLDLNPGWLPWFGRVVSFHYLQKEEIDGRK